MNRTIAKIALLQDIEDPAWVVAGRGPPRQPRDYSAPTCYMVATPVRDISADLSGRVIAEEACAIGEGIVAGAAGGLVADVLPLPDAPPESSPYGPVAPAWAQRHPRLIFAWAWLRALRWVLRDFWRAI